MSRQDNAGRRVVILVFVVTGLLVSCTQVGCVPAICDSWARYVFEIEMVDANSGATLSGVSFDVTLRRAGEVINFEAPYQSVLDEQGVGSYTIVVDFNGGLCNPPYDWGPAALLGDPPGEAHFFVRDGERTGHVIVPLAESNFIRESDSFATIEFGVISVNMVE